MTRLKDILKEAKNEIFSGDVISRSTYHEFEKFYIMDENYFHGSDIEFQKHVYKLLSNRVNNEKIMRIIYNEASSKYLFSQYIYYIYCLGRSYYDTDNFIKEYEDKIIEKEKHTWLIVRFVALASLIIILIFVIYYTTFSNNHTYKKNLILIDV